MIEISLNEMLELFESQKNGDIIIYRIYNLFSTNCSHTYIIEDFYRYDNRLIYGSGLFIEEVKKEEAWFDYNKTLKVDFGFFPKDIDLYLYRKNEVYFCHIEI